MTTTPSSMVSMVCEPTMSMQSIYRTACNVTFNMFLLDNLVTVGGVGIAFGLFEVSISQLYIFGGGGAESYSVSYY